MIEVITIDQNKYTELGLDPLVIPMVDFFNRNGLPTIMSCQGHNDTNMSMFWIEFDRSVTQEDILGFMTRYADKVENPKYGTLNNFPSAGRFAEQLFLGNKITPETIPYSRRWRYFAASVTAANEDLRRWKIIENGKRIRLVSAPDGGAVEVIEDAV